MSKDREEKNIPFKVDISDEDILDAMRGIPGYIDITTGDFRELYNVAYQHAKSRITRSVRAKDIMTKEVISVETETPLKETADLMAESSISGVPVLTEESKVAGIISEKDFLSSMGAKDGRTFMGVVAECLKGKGCVALSIRAQKAKDIMSSPAITVGEETTVNEIINYFTEKNINRVPVVDGNGRLTGIVSRGGHNPRFIDKQRIMIREDIGYHV